MVRSSSGIAPSFFNPKFVNEYRQHQRDLHNNIRHNLHGDPKPPQPIKVKDKKRKK